MKSKLKYNTNHVSYPYALFTRYVLKVDYKINLSVCMNKNETAINFSKNLQFSMKGTAALNSIMHHDRVFQRKNTEHTLSFDKLTHQNVQINAL